MKSERGITLTILVIYIIIFSVVIGLLASLSSYIYGNIKYINDDSVDVSEFNKFNVYFIEDVKSNSQVQIDSQVNSEGKNIVRIVFGDGDIYSFVKEEKSIYKNKQKIAKNIQNFTAVRNQTSDKLKTYIEVGANKLFSPFEKPQKIMAKYIIMVARKNL